MYLLVDSSNSQCKELVKTSYEEKEQALGNEESVPNPDQSDLIPAIEVEVQMAHEPAEDVSLSNVDKPLRYVTESI